MGLVEALNNMTPSAKDHRLGNLILAAAPYAAFTRGDFWFVDAANGNDSNSGADIRDAFQTIQKAVNVCSGVADDYIFLLPTDGTDYDDDTVGASLANAYVYINKSNVHLIGINPAHGQSVIVNPGAAATAGVINLSAAADRVEIAGITFNTTTAANEAIAVTGGANGVWVHDCRFLGAGGAAEAGIVGTNVASCADWVIENCLFYNLDVGAVVGYFSRGIIRNCKIIKTVTAAMTDGISLLDNTTTADSDGAVIENIVVLGGIEGTTPLATGLKVAAACYGVGIINCQVSGCTDNLSYTANTAAAHEIGCLTSDGRNGGAEYADSEDKLNS